MPFIAGLLPMCWGGNIGYSIRNKRYQNTEGDKMKSIRLVIATLLVSMLTYPLLAYSHGGGCRKDSPPGKCCHMDKKKGEVHCH